MSLSAQITPPGLAALKQNLGSRRRTKLHHDVGRNLRAMLAYYQASLTAAALPSVSAEDACTMLSQQPMHDCRQEELTCHAYVIPQFNGDLNNLVVHIDANPELLQGLSMFLRATDLGLPIKSSTVIAGADGYTLIVIMTAFQDGTAVVVHQKVDI